VTIARQPDLFSGSAALPPGFCYRAEFITEDEEEALLAVIRTLALEEAKYKQYTARRRTLSYGSQYDFESNVMLPAPAIPDFLDPLRSAVGRWLELPPQDFVHALITEYRPGTPLGWHRDVPQFGIIVGVSLGGECIMRLRPYRPGGPNRRQDVVPVTLEPRSAYVIRGEARWDWQHSIAPTRALRHSITLRTARGSHA
jgi:alkylated DNA repair dioxygenase AlkB